MSIQIKTPGIHHICLRTGDYNRSKDFYINKLGFGIALEKPNLLILMAGNNAVAIRGPEEETPDNDTFNPFRLGLDHIALACESKDELERVAKALEDHNIENTGIKLDETLNKEYVAFKDPDRISWEFYMV